MQPLLEDVGGRHQRVVADDRDGAREGVRGMRRLGLHASDRFEGAEVEGVRRSTSQGYRRNAPPESPSAGARRESIVNKLPRVLQAENVRDLGSATTSHTLGVRLHRI